MFRTLLLFLLGFGFQAALLGQTMINCKANLQWLGGKEGEKKSDAVLVFDRASNELKGDRNLVPLLTNLELRDSMKFVTPPFHLLFTGHFPLSQPEFFSAADNEKQVTMEARISIGDSVRIQQLSLILTMLRDKQNDIPGGTESYVLPSRANFVIQIDPFQFGLNFGPFRWKRIFTIEVENGIINRK